MKNKKRTHPFAWSNEKFHLFSTSLEECVTDYGAVRTISFLSFALEDSGNKKLSQKLREIIDNERT